MSYASRLLLKQTLADAWSALFQTVPCISCEKTAHSNSLISGDQKQAFSAKHSTTLISLILSEGRVI